ncbi:MAG: PQQ-binding-like beta-propeller repeat protein [bacterium]|nr:PQQ-binding-like beta-propeller repeat protein [bacterium]
MIGRFACALSLAAPLLADEPVQVFLLVGQSNMQGKGKIEHLAELASTPETRARYGHWRHGDDWAERDDVWIWSMDKKGPLTVGYGAPEDRFGPELEIGHVLGEAIEAPVLLVKIAWGGKSLAQDFRPPSAGGETGSFYTQTLASAREVLGNLEAEFPSLAGRSHELAGWIWFQGWNDRVNQAHNDAYATNLAHLIRDVRKDLGAPDLPFVIGETGQGGHEETHPRALSLMHAQAQVAAMPEFAGNVRLVETKAFYASEPKFDGGYHFFGNAANFFGIGEALGHGMLELLEGPATAKDAAPRWEHQTSGSKASLRGLSAPGGLVCWASGADGTVLRTVDGKTWEARGVPGADDFDFRSLHAFDAERAFVLSAGAPTRGFLTEDGGMRWQQVYSNDDPKAFFDAVDFWDEKRGIAFSDPVDGKLLVITTEDGGRTWNRVPAEALPESPAGEAGFAASSSCLRVRGTDEAWIGLGGTAGSRVFRTTDGGRTWSAATTPVRSGEASTGIFSVAFTGESSGVAVGGNYQESDATEANAAITSDGGATWELVTAAPPSGYRSAVAARAAGGELYAVGPSGSDVSNNGGRTWQRFSDEGYHALSVASDGTVWASGSEGRIAKLARPVRATAAWSRFRGPNGTGIAAGEGYPKELGPDTNALWKRAFPVGQSSPVLTRELVILTGVEDERLFTYAVSRASGETVWKREAPRPRRTKFHPKNHAAAASAAVDEDTIVVFFDEYGTLAYGHDGTLRWQVPMGPFDNIYGMGASPILVGDAVIVPCDQSTSSFVVALSKHDGKELWRQERPQAISGHCTPVVHTTEAGRDEVLLPGSFLLDAYDAVTGERIWWVKGLPGEMKSVPVLIDGKLWIHGFASPINNRGNQLEFSAFPAAIEAHDADGDGAISASELPQPKARPYFQFIDLDASGSLDAEEWRMMRAMFSAVNAAMAMDVGGEGDVTEANVTWRYYRSIPQLPSPLVYEGAYYLVADKAGLVTVLAPDTGELIRKERLVDAVDSYYTAPVAADGKVYLFSESGILTVLPAGGSLEPLHTARFDSAGYATPALEDGQVYVRTHDYLYCFQGE